VSTTSIALTRGLTASRLIAPFATVAAVAIVTLATLSVVFHSRWTDTQAALTSTQSDLGIAQATLVTTQSDLSTSQAALAATQSDLSTAKTALGAAQSELSTTTTARDALQSQVEGLNSTVAQVSADRDRVRGDFDKARADADRLTSELQKTRDSLATTSTERDTARSNLEVIGQAGLLLADVVKAYDDYEQVVDQQMRDLLASNNAAVRYDWVSQRYYISQYNNRIALQNQKSAVVLDAIQKLSSFIRTHPSDPGIRSTGTL
jgi:chromosome segregation ATPase